VEQIKEKMAQARQQRERLQNNPRAATEFSAYVHDSASGQAFVRRPSTTGRTASFFLVGVVAGAATMVTFWWLHAAGTIADSGRIQAGGYSTEQSLSDMARLNERIGSLIDSVTSLEGRLVRIHNLTDSIADTASRESTADLQVSAAAVEAAAIIEDLEPTAAGNAAAPTQTTQEFRPTHRINARLNLRPSASLKTVPVSVLETGTRVEYISEVDDWYFVSTESGQQGWCASGYLDSLE
jgi:hypothetical protein